MLEDLPAVLSYVKNAFLNFRISSLREGRKHNYLPAFIACMQTSSGQIVNLLINVTGMDKN